MLYVIALLFLHRRFFTRPIQRCAIEIVEGNPHTHSFVKKRLKRLNRDRREALFHLCAQGGLIDGLELLLQLGTDVNCVDASIFELTALGHACFHGKMEVVKVLLAYGADVNWKSRTGLTAIDQAQRRGFLSIVKLLKQHQN